MSPKRSYQLAVTPLRKSKRCLFTNVVVNNASQSSITNHNKTQPLHPKKQTLNSSAQRRNTVRSRFPSMEIYPKKSKKKGVVQSAR